MIKANFDAYDSYVTDSLYQWDINQVLAVTGLNLTSAPEVHFSNANTDRAIVRQATLSGGVVSVTIPNSLLQDPLTIRAHIGIYDGATFKVVELVEIPIIARKRPADYRIEDTDEELYSFKRLETIVANMVSQSAYNTGIEYVNSRINNIIINGTATEGNAELIDIRLGADGKTYDSAGDATRKQVQPRAGYIPVTGNPDVFGYHELYKDSFITCETVNDTATVTIAESTEVEANRDDGKYWTYWHHSYDITNLVGKNATIVIEFERPDINAWYFNRVLLSRNTAWGDPIYYIDQNTKQSKYRIVFKLDDLGVDLTSEHCVNLVIGCDSFFTPDSNGAFSIPAAVMKFHVAAITEEHRVIASSLKNFDPDNVYTKDEVRDICDLNDYIVCWGDSLTAQAGWTTVLNAFTGRQVLNAGTGGENVKTITARQGADVMTVNNIIIPADTTPVVIADRSTDGGIYTAFGNKATPLLQGGTGHVNPVKIGDIEGTLAWTGSDYADTTGTWTFTRLAEGTATTINRPTAIRTNYDRNYNAPYLMIIFMGQNGGYDDLADLVRKHRLMIEHSNAKHYLILGLSSGNAESRAEYEAAMREAFGRYFVSLREQLSAPIYTDGVITSCYGLDDAGLTATQEDLTAIAAGEVPPQLLSDSVHYSAAGKTAIGKLLYRYGRDLNIF